MQNENFSKTTPAATMAVNVTLTSGRTVSSVLRALDVLADPWSYLLLREAFFGIRRFEDFQRNLGIARNMLSARLEHLVAEDVLVRVAYSERPLRHEYRLTQAGRDFFPAIVALLQWGDRLAPQDQGPPLRLFHRDCGAELKPQVVCSACKAPILAHDVLVTDGPGAGPETLPEPPATRRRGAGKGFLRGRPCSVAEALALVGDRWSLRILRESFFGVKRFEELQSSLGIARNILADRLNSLCTAGLLKKVRYQTLPDRFEYHLDEAGHALYPAMLLFMAWGDSWRQPAAGKPHLLQHNTCGAVFDPVLICMTCEKPISAHSTRYETRYDATAFLPAAKRGG